MHIFDDFKFVSEICYRFIQTAQQAREKRNAFFVEAGMVTALFTYSYLISKFVPSSAKIGLGIPCAFATPVPAIHGRLWLQY